jgi:hypothetical protein
MNYETRQFLGEIRYGAETYLPLIQPIKLSGYILRWFGYGHTSQEAVVGIDKAGNRPVNRFETLYAGRGSSDPYISGSESEYGHWGLKVRYVPSGVYMLAASAAPSITDFLDYLKLIEVTGFSWDYGTVINGIPVLYQVQTDMNVLGLISTYQMLLSRFSEIVTQYLVSRVIPIMDASRWEDLVTASNMLNREANALDPKALSAIIPYAIKTPAKVQIDFTEATTGYGTSFQPLPLRYIDSAYRAQPVYKTVNPVTQTFDCYLPPDAQKTLLDIYTRAYMTLVDGAVSNLAARVAALLDPNVVLGLQNQNLDPTRNPFLVYDAEASAAAGKTTYKNLAKSVAVSPTPIYVTPGVTVGAPEAPIATPEQYKTAGELLTERLRVQVDPYGLPVSKYDLDTTPEKSNLLPWLLAGVAAVAVVKGVTG